MERQPKPVPGVADIITFGGLINSTKSTPTSPACVVSGDPAAALPGAVQRQRQSGGSYVEHGRQQFLIRGLGCFAPRRIACGCGRGQGRAGAGRHIAAVRVGSVPRQGWSGRMPRRLVTGVALMRKGENPSGVLEALKKKIEDLNRFLLPGVQWSFYDRSWLIGRR